MWLEIGKEQVDIEYVDCLLFSMFLNGFSNVLHWILKKGVFSKTYTFVPIVDGGHWNLLILCNFGKPLHKDCGPCMILLDSLHMTEPMSKEPNIRRFVRELYKASGRIETGRAINSIPLLLPGERDENKKLGDRVKDLEERIAKLERTKSKFQLISKRVKLLDMYGNIVAMGIVMSTDPTKIVMGRPIGENFCEVAVLLANKPESPIFIKDDNRKTMKDTIGSHILWFLQYTKRSYRHGGSCAWRLRPLGGVVHRTTYGWWRCSQDHHGWWLLLLQPPLSPSLPKLCPIRHAVPVTLKQRVGGRGDDVAALVGRGFPTEMGLCPA
ncbi:hypothetical protein Taro_056639 [Colocasia esculenta]|uniref:Ubiquitin-like protease family profile domain-containing protein n=1 Tax=Colocasia esculenta TaxID=4460 RepID=A0A843XWS7_COLES|nr:hypothetical protein [Colocasia esculenta]